MFKRKFFNTILFDLFLLFILTFSIYYFVQFNSLALDDERLLNTLLNIECINIKNLFLHNTGAYYRPLLFINFVSDFRLFGLEISFYHLENVIIHFFNAVLLYFLIKKIIVFYDFKNKINNKLILFSTLIFIIYPLNTESVNWISGRSDLLSTFFILSALNFLFLSLNKHSYIYMVYSVFFGFLGILTKENAMAFFVLSLFLILFRFKGNFKYKTLFSLFNIIPPIIYFLLRTNFFVRQDGAVTKISQGVEHFSYVKYILILFKAAGFYIKKLFIFYPLNFAINNVSNSYIYVGMFFAVLCLFCVFKKNLTSDMFLFSVIMFLPALPIAAGNIAWTAFAERYLYTSTAFFSIFILLIIFILNNRFNVNFKLLFVSAFIVFSISTLYRNYQWFDSVRLYEDTLKKSPNIPAVINEYAIALKRNGDIDKSKKVFNKIASKNDLLGVLNNTLINLDDLDKLQNSKSKLLKQIENKTKLKKHIYLTLIKINNHIYEKKADKKLLLENIVYYKNLYDMNKDPFFLYKSGQTYLELGDYDNALKFFEKAYKKLPDNSIYKRSSKKLSENIKINYLKN